MTHDDKRHKDAERQGNDRHQRGAQVPEKDQTDQGDDDKLFQQLEAEVIYGPVN